MPELITIARPYAKAAFEFAAEQQALEQWQQQLTFMAQVVADKQISQLITSDISPEKLADLLLAIAQQQQPDKYIQQFIRLLAASKRLTLMAEISQLFNQYYLAKQNIQIVDVISAQRLTETQLAKIAQAMEQRLSQKVKLNNQTDASLISGFIIRVGDMVIDRSIKGRLQSFADALQS